MVADLTEKGLPLADIGTDHGYLPVSLIQQGRIEKAFLTDINRGPLENALETVEMCGLRDKVTLILCNGMDSPELSECRNFSICGMGGNLISDIISEIPFPLEKGTAFALQPMSHEEDLRETLSLKGFKIIRENLVKDSGRLYLGIKAVYTGEPFTPTPGYCMTGELPKSDKEELKKIYFGRKLRACRKRCGALEGLSEKSESTLKEIEKLQGLIDLLENLD